MDLVQGAASGIIAQREVFAIGVRLALVKELFQLLGRGVQPDCAAPVLPIRYLRASLSSVLLGLLWAATASASLTAALASLTAALTN